jgi:predicted ATPase
MLRRFHIKNFKSLVDFSLEGMGQFVCLTGLNGAGKTTVLQAIDFVAHLATGGLNQWFEDRGWERSDVMNRLTESRFIEFQIVVDVTSSSVFWSGRYDPETSRCFGELFFSETKSSLESNSIKLNWSSGFDFEKLEFQGSVLSVYREFPYESLTELKQFFYQLRSLEMLSPDRMRTRSRVSDDLGLGGEKLAGYIHQLSPDQKRHLENSIKTFYPNLVELNTKFGNTGLAQLIVKERSGLETDVLHINDGLLRILTLIAQVQTEHQFLLFDEIENGINPELVGQLMDYLLNAKQQIMVTTHNPVILNFLPDERAKESVYFLYRTELGETKVTRFFDIPEVAEKLEILGPGEVFLDTSLTQLAAELGKA